MDTHNLQPNTSDWYAWRRSGIGGSDASAVLGVNKYKSPVQVYLEKIGAERPQDDNPFLRWGRLLEPVVADAFAEETGLTLQPSICIQSEQHPFMVGSLDRYGMMQDGTPFILECKTTGERNRKEWEQEHAPVAYTIQLTHYLAIFNEMVKQQMSPPPVGFLAVLIGGNDFRIIRVDRDVELEEMLISGEKQFWGYVERREMPPMDGSPVTGELLERLHTPTVADVIDLPFDAAFFEKRDALQQEIKAKEAELETVNNSLRAALSIHEAGRGAGYTVTWKPVTTNRFDTKTFQKAMPDVYAQYCHSSTSRRLTVKHDKGE